MEQISMFFSNLWNVIVDFDWIFKLITLLFPLIPIIVYKQFPKWIKRFRIKALNANLQYGINLSLYVYSFYLILFLSLALISVSISFIVLSGNYLY